MIKVIFLFNLFFNILLIKLLCFFSYSKNKNKKNILFLENFPIENSGYQYRVKKWANILVLKGLQCEIATIIEDKKEFDKALHPKNYVRFLIFAMEQRFKQLLRSRHYQTIIVRRELLQYNDYGNRFMEKFLLKFHPNAILDFDDDIAAAKNQPRKITNWYGRLLLEDGNKFNNTLRLYKRFIVASNYLKEKVLNENPSLPPENILVIPTCVDYNKYPPKQYPKKIGKITFGWIGSDHNYPLLDTLLPVFSKLYEKKYNFKLLVIGGSEYKRHVNFDIEFVKWSLETEIENLYRIDVGLMPLENNEISKGKGGFKLIQYMGLGIVSVASAVTINCEIIEHGVNSFLIFDDNEWESVFVKILENKVDLEAMGYKARKQIEQKYTFDANKDKYLKFVTSI